MRVNPILAVAALLACDRAPTPAPAEVEVQAAPQAVATPVAPTPVPVAAAVEDGPIGVEACDRYVDNYRRCIADALPTEERPIHTRVLSAWPGPARAPTTPSPPASPTPAPPRPRPPASRCPAASTGDRLPAA